MPLRSDAQLHDEINAGRVGVPAWWTGPEMEALLRNIVDSKANRQDQITLDDLTLTVGGPDTYDPPVGVNEVNLPPDYAATVDKPARRIRVYIGGPDMYTKFAAWSRTTNGFTLTQPGAALEAGQYLQIEDYSNQ